MQKQPNGAACTDGVQCGSSNCVGGVCCNTACNLPCQACNVSGAPGTCSTAPKGLAVTACAPYVCGGTSALCPTSCTNNVDCAAGLYCINGACTSQFPTGQPCSGAGDCSSGYCVDGVCCENACVGACSSCNLSGSRGKCTPAPVDSDPRQLCAAMPGDAGCRAACGANAMCVYPSGNVCQPGACASGTILNQPHTCDGKGACVAGGTMDCTPYLCTGNACPTTCAGDPSVCAAPNQCENGSCGRHLQPGAPCARASDCDSGFCVDAVCCASQCNGPCQRCDLPGAAGGMVDGTCRVPVGSDPDGDCPGDGACHGACKQDQSCAWPDDKTACDTCKACDGAGHCDQLPAAGDDPACMIIACGGLSTECVTFTDLTAARCVGVGLCALPNDPSTCKAMVPMTDGTPCSRGKCSGGTCVSVADASSSGASTSGGCAVDGGRRAPRGSAPALLSLLGLVLLGRARRRRRAS
jgi:hypothetical protein